MIQVDRQGGVQVRELGDDLVMANSLSGSR
jgi:hypothetical protein